MGGRPIDPATASARPTAIGAFLVAMQRVASRVTGPHAGRVRGGHARRLHGIGRSDRHVIRGNALLDRCRALVAVQSRAVPARSGATRPGSVSGPAKSTATVHKGLGPEPASG